MSIYALAQKFRQAEGVLDAFPGGSRVICPDQVHGGSDYDICVLTSSVPYIPIVKDFDDCGEDGDYDGAEPDFAVYRQGEVNVLIFTDHDEFEAVRDATDHATKVGMTDKTERYEYFAKKRAEAKDPFS